MSQCHVFATFCQIKAGTEFSKNYITEALIPVLNFSLKWSLIGLDGAEQNKNRQIGILYKLPSGLMRRPNMTN